MAGNFDRDNSVDQLLKGARRDSTVDAPGPSCIDAETLAAWADGALSGEQVKSVEAHVADCARCQAMAAAFFAATEAVTEPAAKVVPFRRNKLMYWVPIAAGTIAATLLIWLGVRDRNPVSATLTVSEAQQAYPAPAARSGNAQGGQTRAEGTVPVEQPAQRKAMGQTAESKRDQRLDAIAPVELQRQRALGAAAAATDRPAATPITSPRPVVVAATPPPPPPPAPPPPPTPTPTSAIAGQISAGLGQAKPAAATAESVTFRAADPAAVIAQFSSNVARSSTIGGLPGGVAGVAGNAGAGGRGGGAGSGGRGGGGAARVADVAPASPVHWRILGSGAVQKSADLVAWETIPINPPVQGLADGTAPSPLVCWIVGKAGLVLLSTDGRQFTRVTAPTTADLRSVSATSPLHASVMTTDGQTFTTIDGGKTWK